MIRKGRILVTDLLRVGFLGDTSLDFLSAAGDSPLTAPGSSSTQNFQPWGGGPHAGSGFHSGDGRHPRGGVGQLGGELYRVMVHHQYSAKLSRGNVPS
jgi:hypothetical protein